MTNAYLQPLATLNRSDSLALLRRLSKRLANAPDAEIDPLATRLRDLPWALNLAGIYLEKDQRVSSQDYMAEIEGTGNTIRSQSMAQPLYPGLPADQFDLFAVFLATWNVVENAIALNDQAALAARRIFYACAYCAPNVPIPRQLLTEVLSATSGQAVDTFDQALGWLVGLGLLTRSVRGHIIHRLTAVFTRLQDERYLAEIRTRIGPAGESLVNQQNSLMVLSAALMRMSFEAQRTNQPSRREPLRPHLRSAAEYAERAGLSMAGSLWAHLGDHLRIMGDLNGGRTAYERAQAIDTQVHGSESSYVARDLNMIGLVLAGLGDQQTGRQNIERSLAIYKKAYTSVHPRVADVYVDLGNILLDQGDLEAAKEAFKRALVIDTQCYGAKHANVARDVNALGTVLQMMGDIPGARRSYEHALRIDQEVLPPNHPHIAECLENLGSVYQVSGDLELARQAYEQAVHILTLAHGPDHPQVAAQYYELGDVLQAQGDLGAAKLAYERSLAAYSKSVTTDHPSVKVLNRSLERLSTRIGG